MHDKIKINHSRKIKIYKLEKNDNEERRLEKF